MYAYSLLGPEGVESPLNGDPVDVTERDATGNSVEVDVEVPAA